MSEGPWRLSASSSPAPQPRMPGSGAGAGPAAGPDRGLRPGESAERGYGARLTGGDPGNGAGPAHPAGPLHRAGPSHPTAPAHPAGPAPGVGPGYPADGPDDVDYRLPPGPAQSDDAGRAPYPPDTAYPTDGAYPADTAYPAGSAAGRAASRGGFDDGRGRSRWGMDRPGRRSVMIVLAIALASALVGGLLGGLIASGSPSSATSPGYSLGPVPGAGVKRPAGSMASIAARVLPSVVMIRVNGSDGTGSGFVIHGGYIVTDNHVVTLDGHTSSASIQIVFHNGDTAPGRLVGRDTFSDIAVVRPVDARDLRALPLGNSGGLAVGDPVIAFGSPLGLAGTVTSGIVSALNRPVQPGAGNGPAAPQVFLEAIQTDAPINPGNSGGPLVNGRGQVVGVNAAFDTLGGDMISGQGGSIGLGFAIPIDQARRVAVQLIRTGHATHAVIGALLNTRYHGSGAQIAPGGKNSPAVTPGGPAASAGLRSGDVIVSFGGQPIGSAQTLLDAIRARPPGALVRVVYLSHGKTYAVLLRLGSASS